MIYLFYYSFCKPGRKIRQNKANNIENGTQKLVCRYRKEETQEQYSMVPSLPIVPLKLKQQFL